MRKTTLLALAWPTLNLAQSTPQKTATAIAVAAPAAPVPARPYRSALEHGPRGMVQGTDDWVVANARVGQFVRGHSDILKAEQAPGAEQPA